MAYKERIKKIKGKKKADIFLFALSTCGWCRRTKELLNNLGVEYYYIDVDLLSEEEQDEVEKVLETNYKTEASFPKIIINKNVISGFNEEKIRDILENGEN